VARNHPHNRSAGWRVQFWNPGGYGDADVVVWARCADVTP
jgi:hypothetical protein